MERNKKTSRKPAAKKLVLTLSAVLFLEAAVSPASAFAAAESAGVDETLYLNLDYYGNIESAKVVKGINFYAGDTYSDYGDYLSLTNMTNSDELTLDGGKVTLNRPSDGNRLYFQGELDPAGIKAPWTFDISYKYNGVKADAASLAGKSGLIEIDICASPVADAPEYMCDNFMLMAAIPVDGGKYYSVDAPGSQIANIGEMSCVVFEALPGKEGNFEARLGTDCFETVGVIIMMSPITVDDLENIKDLKELKDKFRDNTNAMMDDVEALMDNVTSMSEQLDLTAGMLEELGESKDKIHKVSGTLLDDNDTLVQDLRDLSAQLGPLGDSLKTLQWLIYETNRSLNTIDKDLLSTNTRMKVLSERLKDLGSELSGVDSITTEEIEEEWEEILSGISTVEKGVEDGREASDNLKNYIIATATDYVSSGSAAMKETVAVVGGDEGLGSSLAELNDSLSEIAYGLAEAYSGLDAEEVAEQVEAVSEDIESICSYTGAVTFQTARVLTELGNLTGDMDELVGIMNNYYQDIQDMVTYTDNALIQIQKATDDLADVLQLVNDTLRSVKDNLSNAADYGLSAGEGTIETSREMIENVEELKESGSDLRKSINDELDEQEAENNFLNMDPYAVKVSLTSTLNQEPESVSIICRTAEISYEDEEIQGILDAEDAEKNSTVLERIKNVFVRIYETVKGLFGGK